MSQELFNYLSNEFGATALETNLNEIKGIVKSEYKNVSLHNVEEKAIVVYGKSNGKLVYFRIFDYPNEEFEAKVQFDRLMNDLSIGEYRMMTIDRFSEVIEEGCRVVD